MYKRETSFPPSRLDRHDVGELRGLRMGEVVVVDEEDEVIGHKERKRVHEEGDWHRGVHVLVVDSNGKYLLQRRSEKKDIFPGRWDYSLSEHVDPDEKYLEAARRGLSEELGIESSDLKKLAKVKMNYGPQDNMIAMVFIDSSSPLLGKLNEDEVAKIDYFSEEDLSAMVRDNPEEFTRYFLEFYKWFRGRGSDMKIITDFR